MSDLLLALAISIVLNVALFFLLLRPSGNIR